MHHLKKPAPQVCLESQGPKRLLHLGAPYALNNYEFMVHHVPIYRKHLKDFNEEKTYNVLVFIISLMHIKQKRRWEYGSLAIFYTITCE